MFEIIERHRPTLFFSVPSNYVKLLAHEFLDGREFDLSGVRRAVSTGEALPAPVFHRFKERFGVEILDAIGSTEGLHMLISNAHGDIRPDSSGKIIPGFEAKIVDDNDHPVARGEVGNLIVKADSACAYYWNQHEKTKDTIAGHWLRTGDKYYQDQDNFYWYAGRSDDMVKVRRSLDQSHRNRTGALGARTPCKKWRSSSGGMSTNSPNRRHLLYCGTEPYQASSWGLNCKTS